MGGATMTPMVHVTVACLEPGERYRWVKPPHSGALVYVNSLLPRRERRAAVRAAKREIRAQRLRELRTAACKHPKELAGAGMLTAAAFVAAVAGGVPAVHRLIPGFPRWGTPPGIAGPPAPGLHHRAGRGGAGASQVPPPGGRAAVVPGAPSPTPQHRPPVPRPAASPPPPAPATNGPTVPPGSAAPAASILASVTAGLPVP